MRAVSARLIGDGQQDETPVLDAFDFAFGDAKFGRIDLIVSRVDCDERRFDFFEQW